MCVWVCEAGVETGAERGRQTERECERESAFGNWLLLAGHIASILIDLFEWMRVPFLLPSLNCYQN